MPKRGEIRCIAPVQSITWLPVGLLFLTIESSVADPLLYLQKVLKPTQIFK